MDRHSRHRSIVSCFLNPFRIDINTIQRIGRTKILAFDQHGSDTAERIEYLCIFFQIVSGDLHDQCCIHRGNGSGNALFSINKTFIFHRIQPQKRQITTFFALDNADFNFIIRNGIDQHPFAFFFQQRCRFFHKFAFFAFIQRTFVLDAKQKRSFFLMQTLKQFHDLGVPYRLCRRLRRILPFHFSVKRK